MYKVFPDARQSNPLVSRRVTHSTASRPLQPKQQLQERLQGTCIIWLLLAANRPWHPSLDLVVLTGAPFCSTLARASPLHPYGDDDDDNDEYEDVDNYNED